MRRLGEAEDGGSSQVGRIPSLPRWAGKTRGASLSSALVVVEVVDISLGAAMEDQWAMEVRWDMEVTVPWEDMEGLEARWVAG